jgi:hypothetical protein
LSKPLAVRDRGVDEHKRVANVSKKQSHGECCCSQSVTTLNDLIKIAIYFIPSNSVACDIGSSHAPGDESLTHSITYSLTLARLRSGGSRL